MKNICWPKIIILLNRAAKCKKISATQKRRWNNQIPVQLPLVGPKGKEKHSLCWVISHVVISHFWVCNLHYGSGFWLSYKHFKLKFYLFHFCFIRPNKKDSWLASFFQTLMVMQAIFIFFYFVQTRGGRGRLVSIVYVTRTKRSKFLTFI